MTRAYAPREPLALEPRAFGIVMVEPPKPPDVVIDTQGVALVAVRGPLMHHDDPCADSYDAIKARVTKAIADGARAVVLAIDSPGGLVSGCFASAVEIRANCDAANVALIAHADGMAASAAYALAAVASRVYVSPSGVLGSVGVIDALVDATGMDRAMGLGFTLVASGARKTDGNPHASVTDSAVAATQARVDTLAAVFFDHVAQHRPMTSAQVAALQAGLFVGTQAVQAGLADDVKTLDQVLSLARAGEPTKAAAAATETTMADDTKPDPQEAARSALQAIVDDENADEKAKARAKAALAAFDPPPADDEKKDDAAKAEDAPPAKEPDGDEPARATATAASSIEARIERMERAQIMATRQDLTAEQTATLAKVPTSGLAAALSLVPRVAAKAAATAVVTGTRGAGQGGSDGRMTLEQANLALGIKSEAPGVRRDGLSTIYPALTPTEARAVLANRNGATR